MKIYCKSREQRNILDRYVGKDVWVLCHLWIGGNHWSHNRFWVKFIIDNGDSYVCIAAMASEGEGYRFSSDKGLYCNANKLRTRDKETIKPVEPIEALTTEDLFCLDERDFVDEPNEEQ